MHAWHCAALGTSGLSLPPRTLAASGPSACLPVPPPHTPHLARPRLAAQVALHGRKFGPNVLEASAYDPARYAAKDFS